jgi:C-terminal processing protease CtpA/Prc
MWEYDLSSYENFNIAPIDFFKSLLYVNDKFSYIIDQSESVNISTGNVENYGFESIFGYMDENKTRIGGLVLYVFPNSIAEKEGIKRGDIFISIDDVLFTLDNIENLFQKEQAIFSFIRYDGSDYITFDKMLYREVLEIHPIHTQKIFDLEHSKVGYLCYNQFLNDNGDGFLMYVDELLECFDNFKKNDINELIIDLRYNPGGLLNLSVLLASLIVPNIDTTMVALRFEYNEKIQSIFINNEKEETVLNFSLYPNSYIGNNISRVFFIVSSMTASASEAVINALMPYMNVILVGETTYGKNFASMLFTNENNPPNSYVIMPVVMKVFNSNFMSNYGDGFKPDYQINEFMYQRLYELGDTRETVLNYILSSILKVYPENENATRSGSYQYIFSPSPSMFPNNTMIYEFFR